MTNRLTDMDPIALEAMRSTGLNDAQIAQRLNHLTDLANADPDRARRIGLPLGPRWTALHPVPNEHQTEGLT